MTINPSTEQAKAIDAVLRWHRTPSRPRQWFYLAGYAGVGKTSIAKIIADQIVGGATFAAYTGKAASVLQRKGCPGASTIHRLIYKPSGDEDGRPTFILRNSEDLKGYKLLIIDECSMVNQRLGEDLLSFGVPVLVLGDPAQLPPVSGEGYFTGGTPDFLLTEIHRQAEGSPILRLATMARNGKFIGAGTFKGAAAGMAVVTKWDTVTDRSKLSAHQIIVGTNVTRTAVNRTIRGLLQDTKSLPTPPADAPWMPMPGDKIICLRNKHSRGLLNGAMWRVDESDIDDGQFVRLGISSMDDDASPPMEVSVPIQCFSGEKGYKFPIHMARDREEFTFGYAITAHKSQGSEWQNVLIRNQSFIFEEQRHRWLYTAITRASENLILAN